MLRGRVASLARAWVGLRSHTDRGMSLLPDNHGALDESGARVVDAVEHRLARRTVSLMFLAMVREGYECIQTLSWIILTFWLRLDTRQQ